MPAEEAKKENLIDVGEEEGAEIKLDDKGEPEKTEAPKEEKIEVEQVESTPEKVEAKEEVKEEKKEEELEEYTAVEIIDVSEDSEKFHQYHRGRTCIVETGMINEIKHADCTYNIIGENYVVLLSGD